MTSNNPPYVLAYMADSAGCGYHRIGKPLEILTKAGYMLGRADFQIWSPENLALLKPDVIVWQRQHEDFQIENIRKSREAVPEAFFVYEIDDILSACPDWSPHKHHIPYDVDDRMTKAIKLCEAITVTTPYLANHIKSLCGEDFDVRIVPNMLSREDLVKVDEIRQKSRRIHFKPRIGWGGGISHTGDLALLVPAIEELGDKVEWVFLATKPETSVPIEFHHGTAPQDYLPTLASLDLDLMLAPGVDNLFNKCKSNLRLLEGGACCYPTIASSIEPYKTRNPPVYSYAEPDQWLYKIQEFLRDQNPTSKGKALREWVERYYLFDDHLDDRMKGWLPKGAAPFSPKRRMTNTKKVVFACSEPEMVPSEYEAKRTFEELIDLDCDIIYLRRGTHINKEMVEALLKRLVPGAACVCPLTNDGGFPRNGVFVSVDIDKALGLNTICKEVAKDMVVQIPFPYGPLVILSRKAIDILGFPNITSSGDIEAALADWGVMATARGFKSLLSCETYVHSVFPAPQTNMAELSRKIQLRYNIQAPPDPIQDLRIHLELVFFNKFYKNPVPSQNASYDEWYSIFDTLGQRDQKFLSEYEPELAYKVNYYDNVLLHDMVFDCDWICFIDKSSVITDQFEYFFDKILTQNRDAVFAYSDHDFINAEGKRINQEFKRHTFDYDFLLARDYVSQICAVRTSVLNDYVGKVIKPQHIYELALRLFNERGKSAFVHVPRILAHLIEKPVDQLYAIERSQIASRFSGLMVQLNTNALQYNIVDYGSGVPNPAPKISIIIPTKDRVEMLSPCVESLMHFTDYPNFEVLVIDNGTTEPKAVEYLNLIADKHKTRLTVLSWPEEFNWSKVNNWAIRYAKGDYFLFLNNDTRVAEPIWLSQMVGAALREWVGAVGAKLLYPSGIIQHVGVVHSKGLVGHIHKLLPGNDEGFNGMAICTHSDTAVTGACLLIEREKFKEVGGFDERFAHNFNDVAFCLELNKIGYTNITVCSAVLQHLEGVSRVSAATFEGQQLQRREIMLLSKLYQTEDPYWNPNLSFIHSMGGMLVTGLNYDMLKWPASAWPWRDESWVPERVLLIGDEGTLWVRESQDGNLCFFVMLNGYNIQFVRPGMENVPVLDIRDIDTAKKVVTGLGITKIVVRSILGGIIEVLPFLQALDIPIDYRPNNAEAACPRLDCKQDKETCGFGWRDYDICNQCINTYNSPFGRVVPDGWRGYWKSFMDKTYNNDFTEVPSELKVPIREVFRSSLLETDNG